MDVGLVERERELAVLSSAVDAAAAGQGSAVLLSGEPGIGKTALVRAFVRSLGERAQTLFGSCDELIAPRTLGPVHEAVRGHAGPLAEVLARGADREAVFDATLAQLRNPLRPTVLVVEDVHWADDATVDLLRFLAPRLMGLPAVLVLTYRDNAGAGDDPLQRLLGALAGAVTHRCRLAPLSAEAVADIARPTGLDPELAVRVTAGNPFYLSEMLADPGAGVPATVVDAVRARVSMLPPAVRDAVELLSVVPTLTEWVLIEDLVGDVAILAEAEQRAILEACSTGVRFRHELTRRAIEQSLPVTRRMAFHRRVLAALLARGDSERSKVLHHAVEANDAATIIAQGPAAARQAAAAGAHRQALALYEQVRQRIDLLPLEFRAELLEEHAWELYNGHRFDDAVKAAKGAAEIWNQLGHSGRYAHALVSVSRHLYMANRLEESRTTIERAVDLARERQDGQLLCFALVYHGALDVLVGPTPQSLDVLREALALATREKRTELRALSCHYLGMGHVELGDPHGIDVLHEGLALARVHGHDEQAARIYVHLVRALHRFGLFEDERRHLDEGTDFAMARGLWSHAYALDAQRAILLVSRGAWDEALALLERLVSVTDAPGSLGRFTLPLLARLLVRRGDERAIEVLRSSWSAAEQLGTLEAIASSGIAWVEHAWLAGDLSHAERQVSEILRLTTPSFDTAVSLPRAAGYRAELLRYLARAGSPVEPWSDAPDPWASGLRGDWRAAADAWEAAGDDYERALELAASGQAEPMLEALRLLDGLRATAPATWLRRRLRDLGVRRIPRGPAQATLTNPARLTERQLDVLPLMMEGLTNAEIADRLVISVRTVDHHVSAILAKLEAKTRADAALVARRLGIAQRPTP